MKKVLLMCVVVSLLGNGTALAAEQVISVNPLGLLIGTFNVEYERVIDKDSSWSARGLFWSVDKGHWDWTAFGAGVRYRRYFSPPWTEKIYFAPAGWYWGLGADMLSVSANRTCPWTGIINTGSTIFFVPVGEVGYRWIFDEGFTIGLGADLGIHIGDLVIAGENIPAVNVAAGLTLNFGYAW